MGNWTIVGVQQTMAIYSISISYSVLAQRKREMAMQRLLGLHSACLSHFPEHKHGSN